MDMSHYIIEPCCPADDDSDEVEDDDGTENTNEVNDTDLVPSLLSDNKQFNELHALINEYGLDTIFPPLDGTAFYTTICKINHSCDPNVLVTYSSTPEKGLVANLNTIKPIEAGMELVQSYIDVNLGKQRVIFKLRYTLIHFSNLILGY